MVSQNKLILKSKNKSKNQYQFEPSSMKLVQQRIRVLCKEKSWRTWWFCSSSDSTWKLSSPTVDWNILKQIKFKKMKIEAVNYTYYALSKGSYVHA